MMLYPDEQLNFTTAFTPLLPRILPCFKFLSLLHFTWGGGVAFAARKTRFKGPVIK
jgi:hypothetical protein